MPQLKLTALRSGVPIGFMAALGAFRHAESMGAPGEVRLGWAPHAGQWCAVLETENAVSGDALAQFSLSG